VPATGKLLVATDEVRGPYFAQTLLRRIPAISAVSSCHRANIGLPLTGRNQGSETYSFLKHLNRCSSRSGHLIRPVCIKGVICAVPTVPTRIRLR